MQFSFRILKRMNVSQQRLHACRGAPERVRVSVYCGTVKGPHPSHLPPSSTATVLIPEKKNPNHPHPIGTCCIGIQVSRGSHGIAPGVIGKREEGSDEGGGGPRFSFLFFPSHLFSSLGTEIHATENNRPHCEATKES